MASSRQHPKACFSLPRRSSYFPVKDVVDGDLCAQYPTLAPAKQQAIADEMERTRGEMLKKLEDMRNRIL